MINSNDGREWRNNRWERLDDQVLKAFYKVERKIVEGKIDKIEGNIKINILFEGGYIAKAKILAEEQKCVIGVGKMLDNAEMYVGYVYEILFERLLSLSLSDVSEIANNPLAIKARRIYEIGESNMIKFFEREYEK
tara:strand:+ start:1411 stop:1818 length:408 start_codon:yes stop_codon:yes gene_type:complete